MEILLTRHDEALQWAADKKLARDNNFITYNDAMDMCEEACRAQVRNVVKWLEADPHAIIGNRALQELREAGVK